MRFSFRSFKFLVLVLMLPVVASAQDHTFYQSAREGYYWYHDEIFIEADQALFSIPERDPFSYEQLWDMQPNKFADVLEQRKLIAIQTTTVEDAKRYLEAQDVAKRKSMAVAGAMGVASRLSPELQRQYIAGMSQPAKQAYLSEKRESTDSVLISAADDFALIVFESPGCSYCEVQKPIMDSFQFLFSWNVRHLDFDQYRPLADQFGIEITPSILILSKDNQQAMVISTGVINISQLKDRVKRAVLYMSGEKQPEEWFDDQGMFDPLKFVNKNGRAAAR